MVKIKKISLENLKLNILFIFMLGLYYTELWKLQFCFYHQLLLHICLWLSVLAGMFAEALVLLVLLINPIGVLWTLPLYPYSVTWMSLLFLAFTMHLMLKFKLSLVFKSIYLGGWWYGALSLPNQLLWAPVILT